MSYSSPAIGAVSAFNRFREALQQGGAAPVRSRDCSTCLGQHEEDIHTATLRVHRWFRGEVTKGFVRRPVC